MENLKAKLKNQEGFTMVELLIVVAIIAILVAVSIPMMNSALERSRHAVDQANVRDAIALASVEYVTNPDAFSTTPTDYTYCTDKNSQGYLVAGTDGANGVTSKCTCSGGVGSSTKLTVSVAAPADGSAVGAKPTITTSWHYDGTKTVSGDANA